MQSYINHLLEDIANAQRPEEPYTASDTAQPQTIEEHFAEVEQWLEHEPVHTFSYYCGLEKEQFPPADKLTEEQLQQITKAFRQLLYTWNLDANIPKHIPPDKSYSLLVSVLDEKTDIVNSGIMTFEFCNYDPPSCPFEQYCTCKDFEDDSNDNMNTDVQEGDLPF